jgi:hypothetical protein
VRCETAHSVDRVNILVNAKEGWNMRKKNEESTYPRGLLSPSPRLIWAMVVGMMTLLCTRPANGQYKLCFPSGTWYGNPAPNLSSFKVNDAGWINSFRYVFGNGTSAPQYAVVQGIRDASNNLFFSFEGEGLTSLTQASGAEMAVVVLALDFRQLPTDTGPLYRIVVHPVHNAPAVPPTDPALATGADSGPVTYWTGTASATGIVTWTQCCLDVVTGQIKTPTWLLHPNNQVGYWGSVGNYNWFLETEIPNVDLPAPATFGLYINIFREVSGYYQESWWPPVSNLYEQGCPPNSVVTNCTPQGQTPNPGPLGPSYVWGKSSIDPTQSCKGVSVTPVTPPTYAPSIFTNNSPNSQICIHNTTPPSCPANPNIFTVKVDNSSVNGTGTAQSAPNVEATFSIANFGLQSPWDPSQWTKISGGIPPVTNPTSPVTLGPNSTATALPPSGSWFPVPNPNNYDPSISGSHPHQCIMVTLDSTSGNVDFINNSAIQNMDFVDASKFERSAEINAKGYPPRPDNPDGTHNPGQLFDLRILSKTEVLKPEEGATVAKEPGSKGGRVVSQLTWVLQGCRHTGRFMLVDDAGNDPKEKRQIELCDPVGAFGYIIRHRGKHRVKDWNLQFTGPNLTVAPGQPNTYQILIPQDGVATVTTHAEPQDQGILGGGKVAAFLDAGAGVPHGIFSNAFNTGFSFNAGLEYIATTHFSAESIFGYHHFPAKVGSALDLYQFSANGKAYLTNVGPLRPFVNGGIGGYKLTPGGGTYFGGNVGAGVLREFSSHWGLQASYNFHTVNTPVAATKFSTAQVGIRFVF